MKFEQPKHLNVRAYQKYGRAIRSIGIRLGMVASGMLILILVSRSFSGPRVSIWEWAASIAIGLWVAGLILLGAWCLKWQRSYIEFKSRGLFLSRIGVVSYKRIASWSFSDADPEMHARKLIVVRKLGRGRCRWSMWMDDETQIASLRARMAGLGIPETPAGSVA